MANTGEYVCRFSGRLASNAHSRRVGGGDARGRVELVARRGQRQRAAQPDQQEGGAGRQRRHDPLAVLTPREREVLALVAEGYSNGAIAARLTVDDSHQALAICHDVLLQAGNDLSKALADWKKIEKIKDIRALLKKDYQIEQNWLVKQQDNLNKTATVVTNVQTLITKANAKGKDTTALVNALAVFQSQIATSQSSHTTAAGILATHNGFDAKGNVIDRDAARLTVNSARQSLSDAHALLWQAANDLHQAIKEWRENNK